MSNTEWKNGYDAGFTAGWKAAKVEVTYTNYPPVYYGGASSKPYNFSTMVDTTSRTYAIPTGGLSETKTIRNVADHTLIV